MNITKIKHSSKGITTIEYREQAIYDGLDGKSIESNEPPLPDFHAALQALVPMVCDILQLPVDYGDTMSIIGVTYKAVEDTECCVISATKTLSNGQAANINTPLCVITEVQGLSHALLQLDEEARRFVTGQRAQAELAGVA